MTGNAKKNKRTTRGKQDERTMKGLGPGTWVKWKGGRQGSILRSMLHAPKACRNHMDSKLFWGGIAASYMFLAQCSRAVQLHKTKDTATVQTKGKETEQMTGNAKKNKRTMTGKQDERTMKGLGPGTWVKWKGGRQGSVLSSMLRAPKASRYHMDSKLFWGRIAASYVFLVMISSY